MLSKLVLFYMWWKLKQTWTMQFTCLVFLLLTASLNIPPKNLLRRKFDSQNASSPIMFLIGKLVRDLIISQILLKMPDFEQAVVMRSSSSWGTTALRRVRQNPQFQFYLVPWCETHGFPLSQRTGIEVQSDCGLIRVGMNLLSSEIGFMDLYKWS